MGNIFGVYILTETVSKGKHRINLSDPGLTGDSITGGYIMEVNRIDDEVTYTSKYHPVSKTGVRYMNQYINFQYKSPDYEDLTQEQVSYITGRIDQMEQSLWNYKPNNTPDYEQYLDVTNFIDYQLAMELGHNVDAYRLSGKFFKRRDSEDPRFKMVVWDMNLAYGNSDYYEGWRTNTWMYQNNNTMNAEGDPQLIPFWWYKLNTSPEYTAALKTRWAQYRRANLRDDRIMATVDSLATVLTSHGAEARNSQAWPRWGEHVWPNYYVAEDFQDEVGYLKEWLTERIAWMDGQLGYDPSACERGDVDGDGQVNINDVTVLINYLLSDNATGVYLDAADCDLSGNISIRDVTALINFLLGESWD